MRRESVFVFVFVEGKRERERERESVVAVSSSQTQCPCFHECANRGSKEAGECDCARADIWVRECRLSFFL